MSIVHRVRGWISHIPEPKNISIILGLAYLIFVVTGLATLITPPVTIVGAAGEVTMALVGWFFLAGGLIGMLAGTLEFWQLERAGIAAMTCGLATYGFIIIELHITTQGSRLTQFGLILIALCFLALRFAMIWRYDFKPRG